MLQSGSHSFGGDGQALSPSFPELAAVGGPYRRLEPAAVQQPPILPGLKMAPRKTAGVGALPSGEMEEL